MRNVEPRIAYRGVPPEDMPVSVAVQPFPAERFGHNVDAVVSSVTDGDLAGAVSRPRTTALPSHPALTAGVSGVLSANPASGNGNLQANAVAIAPGAVAAVELASDGLLASAAAHGGTGQLPASQAGRREATVDPRAYRDVSGVVQLNQAAGSGNASSNVFVLRPPTGATF